MRQRPDHTRRLARGLALGVVLTGLLASSVSAATTRVDAADDRTFTPAFISRPLGTAVHWTASGADDHSVLQDEEVFSSGIATPGLEYTRRFSAGTFAYHCELHGEDGMRGMVRIPPQVGAGPKGLPFTVRWATARSDTGNRFDVQYRVGKGRWRPWMRGTRLRSAVFGARSRPVRVARGRTYSFRAVSGASASAKSGVSPVTAFRVR